MHNITPTLWFDDQAEAAADFYASLLPDSEILGVARYTEANAEMAGKPVGSVMLVRFQLVGQEFIALNGGPEFDFSPAVSFALNCHTQQEIDVLWDRLSEGGDTSMCGWLTDKFGVTWQITARELEDLVVNPDTDPESLDRVMRAMLEMEKIDIATLRQAATADW